MNDTLPFQELSDVEYEALKSLGPIFHYMGEWKEGYEKRIPLNGLFFGDIWVIRETKQTVVYLGDSEFKWFYTVHKHTSQDSQIVRTKKSARKPKE